MGNFNGKDPNFALLNSMNLETENQNQKTFDPRWNYLCYENEWELTLVGAKGEKE